MDSMTRIFIVDDHPAMRHGIVQLVDNEEDFEVCGQAGDWKEILDEIEKDSPDFLILDISLNNSDRNGIDLIPFILSSVKNLPILIYSMHDEKIYAEQALRAGARGYLMKQEPVGMLIEAIRKIINDGIYISDEINKRMLLDYVGLSGDRPILSSPESALTHRELEIFMLIGEGLQPRQIAKKLYISTKTVEAHRIKIRKKYNLANASELIRFAINYRRKIR